MCVCVCVTELRYNESGRVNGISKKQGGKNRFLKGLEVFLEL